MCIPGLGLLLLVSSPALQAAQCPAPPDFVYQPSERIPFDPSAPVEATADSVSTDEGMVTLTGDTRITFQNRTLIAENARYNRETGEVEIAGNMSYESNGIRLSSSNAKFDLSQSTFATGRSEYEINLGEEDRATGDASAMVRDDRGLFKLQDATYSTCPPGDKSWFIKAREIILDTEEGIGTANRISLNFQGVPVFAVPTFSFPIGPKRKTGFLAPVLARSESTGFELHMPWYWNIRPNLDATFTPRITTKRGTQLKSEFRYLNKLGDWRLDYEYLYDDERIPEERQRTFSRLRHAGSFGEHWSTELDASAVSDKDYFEDLGDSLQIASISHLERRADLRYDDKIYSFLARVQSYQTVDKTIAAEDRPYKRLPQFKFNADWPKLRFGAEADLDAELVYFDRDSSKTALRFDVQPRISWPVNRPAWFFKPTLTTRYTYYDINNAGAGNPSQITRAFSTTSVDAGLFFDRAINNKGRIQTLEPRLFYLRVPHENQDQIPVFDSAELDFNFSQLFRENRFSGSDRVADANQLSLALTSRLIEGPTGREQLLASFGQIFYFADRRVTLDNTAVDKREVSDFVAEVSADLDNDWNFKTSLQWNPDDTRTVRSSALLSYRPAKDRIFNIGHRLVNTGSSAETEQLDLSFLWPVRDSWRVAGRWNYSLAGDTSIESMLGIEYEDCCWAFRLAARRYISDDGSDHDKTYYLQLVLKGLAPLGENIGELLETGVLGYQDAY